MIWTFFNTFGFGIHFNAFSHKWTLHPNMKMENNWNIHTMVVFIVTQLTILLGLFSAVTFLIKFYDKRFRTTTRVSSGRRSSPQISQWLLWTMVVIHITNPWFLWSNTRTRFLFCAILCASVQVPPFRGMFKRRLGYWPSILLPYMLTQKIDSTLRQSLGVPFVLYTIASSIMLLRDDAMHSSLFIITISMVSSFCVLWSGVLVRPDNDWAHISWMVGPIHTKKRRQIHACFMIASFILNTLLLFLSCLY